MSHRASKRASCLQLGLTDVAALNGGLGGTETQTNVLVPSAATLARSGRLGLDLAVLEDVRLLLESTLRLDGQFGGHFCGGCRGSSNWSLMVECVVYLSKKFKSE